MAQQINEITKIPSNSEVIKILNQIIKRYNSLGDLYQYKGSVQTYDDLLAIQNPQIGDVYNVIQEDVEEGIAAGSNFAWNGTEWDNLGMGMDGLVKKINGFTPDDLGAVIFQYIKTIEDDDGTLTVTIRNGEEETQLTIQTGKVKTVNGVEPDENGNVPNIARTDVANNFVTGQKFLKHPTVSDVGGQLFLEKPEVSTLAGDVVIDVMGEMLRFREKGGSGRGFNMNIASGAANCQSPIVTSVNGVKADYTGNIQLENFNAIPVGTILALLDYEVPEGYLPAEGAEISRTTYADLFNVIGTKFGVGDGSTTFSLPNLVGRFLEGDGTPGTLKEPGLPNITGYVYSVIGWTNATNNAGSALYTTETQGNYPGGKVWQTLVSGIYFNASRANLIYGAAQTVQPKSITVKFIIKY